MFGLTYLKGVLEIADFDTLISKRILAQVSRTVSLMIATDNGHTFVFHGHIFLVYNTV